MLTAPVSVTLFADGEVRTAGRVEVAAVTGRELPTNVVTRWTTLLRRSVGIALALACVTGTVKSVVVATVLCDTGRRQHIIIGRPTPTWRCRTRRPIRRTRPMIMRPRGRG